MLLDLPLCSPRKTNLNFLKGFPKSPAADMTVWNKPYLTLLFGSSPGSQLMLANQQLLDIKGIRNVLSFFQPSTQTTWQGFVLQTPSFERPDTFW